MFTNNPLRKSYQKNIEIGYVLALVLSIVLIRWAASVNIEVSPVKGEVPVVTVEPIPKTEQGKRRPLPPRPAVPIPSEDDIIPEEETIEPIKFQFYSHAGDEGGGGAQDEGIGAPTIVPPRPIAWVIPEYPE